MLWVILAIIVIGFVVYRFRVPILGKLLGQSDARVQRYLERRKRP